MGVCGDFNDDDDADDENEADLGVWLLRTRGKVGDTSPDDAAKFDADADEERPDNSAGSEPDRLSERRCDGDEEEMVDASIVDDKF